MNYNCALFYMCSHLRLQAIQKQKIIQSPQPVVLGKLNSYMWNNEIRTFSNTQHKNKHKNGLKS